MYALLARSGQLFLLPQASYILNMIWDEQSAPPEALATRDGLLKRGLAAEGLW